MTEVNATYWNGGRHAISVDAFDVLMLPPPLMALRAIFMSWITYLILFGIVPAFYGGQRAYRYWKLKKTKKARYIFPLDMSKLPKAGPTTFMVGKIAETNNPAYFDMNQLLTHQPHVLVVTSREIETTNMETPDTNHERLVGFRLHDGCR